MLKYGFDDARPVLERASARETAARVAAGTIARAFLRAGAGRRGAVARHLHRRVQALRRPAAAGLRPVGHRRQPGARLRRRRREADDRRDRGRQEGRRHARRRRRGRRPRAARRARLVHQRRQPARQPAGRCGDGHPGDQGRRDRRRLRNRAPARQRRPRRDVSRARTA